MSMIKSLFFVAIVLFLGLAFAWLADRPGEIVINWQNQQIEMSLMVAMSLLLGLIVTVMFVWWVIQLILNSPKIMAKFMKTRRKDRGYNALSQGLIAAGAGDVSQAKKLTKQSKNLLGKENEPLIQLLDVQTAMIEGRHDDVRSTLEEMAEQPETASLGLRGLYLEAKRLGAEDAAKQYAFKAADNAPHLEWAGHAAIEYHAKEGDWDNAIRRLERQRTSKVIDPLQAKRTKAILLTARAMSHADGELAQIAQDANSALSLAPDLVPAALIAAKAHFQQGQLRRGARILEKIWRTTPHPQLADAYVAAKVGDSAANRLKRAQKLAALHSDHVESHVIVAKTALDARQFDRARTEIEAAARLEPRESMYLLLADIEEADGGDDMRVRHWLSQALRATPDPQWTADGYVSKKWAPFSPVTGALDAFEWKIPLATLKGPVTDAQETGPNSQQESEQGPTHFDDAIAALPSASRSTTNQASTSAANAQASSDLDVETNVIEAHATHLSDADNEDAPSLDQKTQDQSDHASAKAKEGADAQLSARQPQAANDRSAPNAAPSFEANTSSDTTSDATDQIATVGETTENRPTDDAKTKQEELVERLSGPIDDPGVEDDVAESDKKNNPFRLF